MEFLKPIILLCCTCTLSLSLSLVLSAVEKKGCAVTINLIYIYIADNQIKEYLLNEGCTANL